MTTILDLYLRGGWVMHPILLCSLISLYYAVERYAALRRGRSIPGGFINEMRAFIRRGDLRSALLYATRFEIPIGRIVKAGLAKIHRGHARAEQAMEEQGRTEAANFEKHMGILATMAGVAPLLGFLGTVWGIAIAFEEIARHGGQVSPDLLADGISQALYTTVFGLVVGIPVFAVYNWLTGQIQRAVVNLEATAREMIDVLEEDLPGGVAGVGQPITVESETRQAAE
jgi:biopolymer transport protein ExbB